MLTIKQIQDLVGGGGGEFGLGQMSTYIYCCYLTSPFAQAKYGKNFCFIFASTFFVPVCCKMLLKCLFKNLHDSSVFTPSHSAVSTHLHAILHINWTNSPPSGLHYSTDVCCCSNIFSWETIYIYTLPSPCKECLTLTSSHLLFSRCHLFWDHLRSWAPGLPRETRLLPWFANRRYWHCLRSLV